MKERLSWLVLVFMLFAELAPAQIGTAIAGETSNALATERSVCGVDSAMVDTTDTAEFATTTTLSSSQNPQLVDQPVALTASISSSSTGTPATGTVTFSSGSLLIGTATVAGNQATLTASFAVTSSIIATYSGDTNNLASASEPLLQEIVSRFPTNITLISSLPTSSYGQYVTLIATVSGPLTPTGAVILRNGSTILEVGTLDDNVTLRAARNNLPVGSLTLSATYIGSATLAPSVATVTQIVNQATSSVTLLSSVNPSISGQAVELVATVNAGPAAANGTVIFTANGVSLGTATLIAGRAVLVTNSLPPGQNAIVANYGGNTNIAGSSSPSLTQQVN